MSELPNIDPATLCADCDKPWSEHWGFNCDSPYADRKWKPLLAGYYPPNRAREIDAERVYHALREVLDAIDAHDRYDGVCDHTVASDEDMKRWKGLAS